MYIHINILLCYDNSSWTMNPWYTCRPICAVQYYHTSWDKNRIMVNTVIIGDKNRIIVNTKTVLVSNVTKWMVPFVGCCMPNCPNPLEWLL